MSSTKAKMEAALKKSAAPKPVAKAPQPAKPAPQSVAQESSEESISNGAYQRAIA